jgi:hypothetical protein
MVSIAFVSVGAQGHQEKHGLGQKAYGSGRAPLW